MNKADVNSTYYGTQHFRSGSNIAAPRDGVPIDSNDAATDTITDTEEAAIPDTTSKLISTRITFLQMPLHYLLPFDL